MPEETTPSPTLEEGAAQPEPQNQPEETSSLDEVRQLLEESGITSAKQLAGTLETSSQYGNVARLLKEERDRNTELQRELAESQTRRMNPNTEDDLDLDNYRQGDTVDIARLIDQGTRRAVRSEWDNIQKEQAKRQEMAVGQYTKIRKDNLYDKVGPLFEEKMKDPTFAYEVQMGLRDPVDEYRNLKDEFYQRIIKQTHETITKMQGGGQPPGKTPAPHVETGERTGNIVSESKPESDQEKMLAQARDKVKQKGYLDDEEELDVIDAIFPGRM